jgi:ribosomal protein S20
VTTKDKAPRELSSLFGRELYERVTKEVRDFDRIFSEAVQSPSAAARDELVDAADRVMRAVARVIIHAKRASAFDQRPR